MKRSTENLAAIIFFAAQTLCAAGKPLSLSKVQKTLDLPDLEKNTNTVTVADGTNSIAFRPGYRRTVLNGAAVWLNEPAESDFFQTLRVARPDANRLLKPIIDAERSLAEVRGVAPRTGAASTPCEPSSPFRVFIDAGHGGEDSGAISAATKQREKDLVLDVALRLGALLEDEGFAVSQSRTNDVFVSLDRRSDLAKKENADIFVSVHANTTGNKDAQGIETFSLSFAESDSTSGDTRISKKEWPGNTHDKESSVLGYFIHASMNTARGDADRGFRHARFQVLRRAPCPAVLVECGFLSNEAENTSLASPRYRQRLACAIANGIKAYALAIPKEMPGIPEIPEIPDPSDPPDPPEYFDPELLDNLDFLDALDNLDALE